MWRLGHIGRMWFPVTLPVEGEDGEQPTIRLLARIYTREELKARENGTLVEAHQLALAAMRTSTAIEDVQAAMEAGQAIEDDDLQELHARIEDWAGISDEDGAVVDFDADKLAAMLAMPWFFKTVRQQLFKVSREGVAKNSSPGPGSSPVRVQA